MCLLTFWGILKSWYISLIKLLIGIGLSYWLLLVISGYTINIWLYFYGFRELLGGVMAALHFLDILLLRDSTPWKNLRKLIIFISI